MTTHDESAPAHYRVTCEKSDARAVDAAAHTPKLGRAGDSVELFERWQRDGDAKAREQLVARFLPLARKLALRYAGGPEPLEDRVQVASLGLLKAIDRFDASRGVAFTSYSVPTVLGELKRYFRDVGWSAHVPRGAQQAAIRLRKAEEQLTTRLGRSPTMQELAEHLGLSLEQTLDARQAAAAQHSVGLEAPANETPGDDRLSIVETLGEDDTRFELILSRLSITMAAGQLTAQQRRVLGLRFGQDLTQGQIAERVGVSQMQVSRILRTALTKLNELVEHAQTGDRMPGDEVVHGRSREVSAHSRPPVPGRSPHDTRRWVRRKRPQPAMG